MSHGRPGVSITLGELAVKTGSRLEGDPDQTVSHVATLSRADGQSITFLANPKYARQLAGTGAGAVILHADQLEHCPVNALIADDPYVTYARVAALLYPPLRAPAGVHAAAVVAASARVGAGASVGANAVIEDDVVLGDGAIVGPGCVIGRGSRIGADTRLAANVTLYHGVEIGQRVVVHSGVVIGADGFGMARTAEGWLNVPQVGGVRIGNDVNIGAATTIDRGAIDDTVIGDGVRLDNLIQIAHNVVIGEHTVMAACVGVSGSTRIGRRCMIGGAACFAGHLEIGDDVVVTGMAMVTKSLSGPGVYSSGIPVEENRRWARGVARYRQLDGVMERLKALEGRLSVNGEGK
jgi:UDP-3-O-[3-hydroxymyristoyl] glucosamine N-acyltransferase